MPKYLRVLGAVAKILAALALIAKAAVVLLS